LQENSLSKLRPDLAVEWNSDLSDTGPEDVSLGSNFEAGWICPKGHKYQQKVCHRTRKNGIGCPICAGRLGSNIFEAMPEMVGIWDFVKNTILTPKKTSPGSQKNAWFMCEKKHTFEKRIGSVRTALLRSRNPCPYCNKSLASADYNLAAIFPEIAKEWDAERNDDSPEILLPSVNKKKYWWVCKKGHSYDMTVNARTNNSSAQGCPICSGQRVIKSTALSTVQPNLLSEWDYAKNKEITPDQVTVQSNVSVWWKCKHGHTWKAPIYSRSQGKGCSKCSNQTSRPELRIFSELEAIFNNVQHRYLDGKTEFDIFLPDFKVAIEYDGSFYHSKKNKQDQAKNDKAKSMGIKLLRIREWPLKKIIETDIVLLQDNALKKEL